MIILGTRVVAHRLIDQIVNRAVKVVGHLLERPPKDVTAVKVTHRLLTLIHVWLYSR